MSLSKRLTVGVSAALKEPQFRRTTAARLKWLLRGSGSLPAWSLEYRAGLTGRFQVPALRTQEQAESVLHCPPDCGAHAPLSHVYERRFVYQLKDTVVSSQTGATILLGASESPFFIRESISWPFESILSHGLEIPEIKKAQGFQPRNPREPVMVFPADSNYYHWLIEELPLVLRAHREFPTANYITFKDTITPAHRAVAELLSITVDTAPLRVRLANQVLPGRSNDSWFIHPLDAHMLHDFGSQLTNVAPAHVDNIYVSRRFVNRSLPHEAEVERELARQGFMILHLEKMSWRDQIAAFQRAQNVVAPHGAGLSNLVFSHPRVRLVELTNGYHYNRCFEWICHVSGHTYRKVDADADIKSTNQLLSEINSHLH